jgi:hypothetical protein
MIAEKENTTKIATVGQGVQWGSRTGTTMSCYDNRVVIRFDDNFEEKTILLDFVQPSEHSPLPIKLRKPSTKYLKALNLDLSIVGIREFIAYLHTPGAHCTLELEARNPDFDSPIREQYTRETGEELVEGKGYRIAPYSANKQGSEGSVRFEPLAEYPANVVELLSPDGTGHINHIGFVWLLVKEGFRVSR